MKKENLTKNHVRNRLMDCYIPKAPTYATITKLPHCSESSSSTSSSSASNNEDLVPFVLYSMNKKRRWEIPMNSVRENEDGVKSFIFDREINDLYNVWWSFRVSQHQNVYAYSKPTDPKLMEMAKSEEHMVGYHVFRAPKNFKKVFDHKCTRYIGLRYPDFLGYVTRELLTPLEYELKENEGDNELPEVLELEEEDVEPKMKPSGFYNLEDHIIEKKRKPKLRGWSVV